MIIKNIKKKPVVVQSSYFDGTLENATDIQNWIIDNGGEANIYKDNDPYDIDTFAIVIETLEGPMSLTAGNILIRGVKGEFYPIRYDIYDETYEDA